MAIAVSVLAPGAAYARSASARMNVSATVIARAVVTVDAQPDVIDVSDADVARGYVELGAPMAIRIRTNSPAGYVLQANLLGADFTAIDLSFADSAMRAADDGSMITRPYVPGGDTLSVHARLTLARGTPAGRYALPVAITAHPL